MPLVETDAPFTIPLQLYFKSNDRAICSRIMGSSGTLNTKQGAQCRVRRVGAYITFLTFRIRNCKKKEGEKEEKPSCLFVCFLNNTLLFVGNLSN